MASLWEIERSCVDGLRHKDDAGQACLDGERASSVRDGWVTYSSIVLLVLFRVCKFA